MKREETAGRDRTAWERGVRRRREKRREGTGGGRVMEVVKRRRLGSRVEIVRLRVRVMEAARVRVCAMSEIMKCE